MEQDIHTILERLDLVLNIPEQELEVDTREQRDSILGLVDYLEQELVNTTQEELEQEASVLVPALVVYRVQAVQDNMVDSSQLVVVVV